MAMGNLGSFRLSSREDQEGKGTPASFRFTVTLMGLEEVSVLALQSHQDQLWSPSTLLKP